MRLGALGLLLGVCLLQSPQVLAKEAWKFDIGAYYSTGDYGLDDALFAESQNDETRITMIPVSLRYKQGPWQFKVSSGWVQVEGRGNLASEEVGANVQSFEAAAANVQVSTSKESSVADTILSVKRVIPELKLAPVYIDVTAKIKLPTADQDKRLSTGETDGELLIGGFWWRKESVSPYFKIGHKWRGQPDRAVQTLNDSWRVNVGAHKAVSKHWDIMLQIEAREAALDSSSNILEVAAFSRWKLNQQQSVTAYLVKGLEDGSPDWAAGLQHSTRF